MFSKTVSYFLVGILCGALVATAVFAGVRSGKAGGQTQTVIKLGHSLDVNHPVHQALLEMQKELA
ncbi:TRAP transporter substrate-binding protein, partial [candidate division KSB1 bacterium]|nr:TRAP transporter substrate-binding protein [candidate division KSB1 bacterium]